VSGRSAVPAVRRSSKDPGFWMNAMYQSSSKYQYLALTTSLSSDIQFWHGEHTRAATPSVPSANTCSRNPE